MRTAPSKNMVVRYQKPDRLDNPAEFLADDFEEQDIQPAVNELVPICDGFRRHSFAWHYDVGKVVRSHYEQLTETRTSMYGQRFFNRLELELKRPNVSGQLLTNCFRLVKQYTEQEYLRYVQQPEVSPTHLLILASIEDRKLRKELIQKVIEEKLTTQQLHAEMKQRFGMCPKGKPGRPLKIPKSAKAGLTHFAAQAEKFVKLNDEVWFGQYFDLADEISNLPAEQLTDDFQKQLSSTVEKCDSLATTATNDAKALRAALVEVERRRVVQAEEKEFEREQQFQAKRKARPPRRTNKPRPNRDRRIGRELHAI